MYVAMLCRVSDSSKVAVALQPTEGKPQTTSVASATASKRPLATKIMTDLLAKD
jgi:hypothetical protein